MENELKNLIDEYKSACSMPTNHAGATAHKAVVAGLRRE